MVTDLLIDSPTYAGIQIAGAFAVTDLSFTNMTIARAGTYGILVDPATVAQHLCGGGDRPCRGGII